MPETSSARWSWLRGWIVRAVSLAAALLGLSYGFEFGLRLGGLVLGIVAAVNCGVLGALAAGGLAEKLLPVSHGG